MRHRTLISVIFSTLDRIVDIFLQLSIPQLGEEGEFRGHTPVMPLSAMLTILVLTGGSRRSPEWSVSLLGLNITVVSVVLGIIAAFVLNRIYKKESHKVWLQWTILALNMICSILWLSTAAGTIVDLIEVRPIH